MPYVLKLSPTTRIAISEYILESVERGYRTEVLDEIHAALDRLAAEPWKYRQPGAGPVPLYRFSFKCGDGITRYLQVSYSFTEDETAIGVTSFGRVSL